MNVLSPPRLYMALLHYPVKNKNGETIASAVTNLDLHDISRVAKTYGVDEFYVVTPLSDQKELIEKIISHWIDGRGGEYNPKRREALNLVKTADSLAQAIEEIRSKSGLAVKVVATCANNDRQTLKFGEFRQKLSNHDCCYLLVFGTGWGLTEEFLENADFVLEPIKGNTAYNHLSVRSAASIILDRVLSECR